jgi:hypothetical protein
LTVDQLGRAVDLYRQTATTRSAVLLVAVNLIPLVGVLFFGWSLLTVLALYWLENGIVGFWNVPKIMVAGGAAPTALPPMPDELAFAGTDGDLSVVAARRAAWEQARAAQQRAIEASSPALQLRLAGRAPGGGAGRVALAGFFLVHYGIFWLGHGLFLFLFLPTFFGGGNQLLPACGDLDPFGNPQGCFSPFGTVVWSDLLLAGIALFISHGASFLFNYIGRGEYLTTTPMRQMTSPYGRVVVLHLTIIFGGLIVAALGAPIGALLVLVVLKTAFDLGLHLRERRASTA